MNRRRFPQTTALAGVHTIASGFASGEQANSGLTRPAISIKTHGTKGALPLVGGACRVRPCRLRGRMAIYGGTQPSDVFTLPCRHESQNSARIRSHAHAIGESR
jgi:hypothetical protein